MSDEITIQVGRYFAGQPKKHEDEVAVYTGPYEKFKLESKEQGAEQLVVKLDEKGKVVAVLYGEQILPFATEMLTDRERVGYFRSKYARRMQGVILAVLGERPKGR